MVLLTIITLPTLLIWHHDVSSLSLSWPPSAYLPNDTLREPVAPTSAGFTLLFFYCALDVLTPFIVCSYINNIPVLCCGIGFVYIPNFSLLAWMGVFLFSSGFSNDMAFLSTKSWMISLNFWHSHVLFP